MQTNLKNKVFYEIWQFADVSNFFLSNVLNITRNTKQSGKHFNGNKQVKKMEENDHTFDLYKVKKFLAENKISRMLSSERIKFKK
jgi:hypothetical protein